MNAIKKLNIILILLQILLTVFKDSKEKEILKNLTSFSLARNF